MTNTLVTVLSSPGLTGSVQWYYPYYVGQASDTLFTSPANSAADGFTPTPAFTIRVPTAAAVSNDSDAICTIGDASNPTLYAAWYDSCTIDRTGNTIGTSTSYGAVRWDTSGNGIALTGQGNHHPGLQGLEIDQGFINRTLPCKINSGHCKAHQPQSDNGSTNVYGQTVTHGSPYNCVWPAIASDFSGGSGAGSIYSTSNASIPFGSIIFTPPSVLTAALGSDANQWSVGGTNPLSLAAGGIMMAKQMQNYGIHIENTGGSFDIYCTQDAGSRTTTLSQMASGLTALRPYMRVLLNWMCYLTTHTAPSTPLPAGYQYDPFYNASAPINGGGTYPSTAPYWDASLPSTFTDQNTY
jgi:hypothetical protein